jgi:hypothetical protein
MSSVERFNSWGVTLIDSLDTMFLMGLNAEFALPHVNRTQFTFEPVRSLPPIRKAPPRPHDLPCRAATSRFSKPSSAGSVGCSPRTHFRAGRSSLNARMIWGGCWNPRSIRRAVCRRGGLTLSGQGPRLCFSSFVYDCWILKLHAPSLLVFSVPWK